MMQYVKFQCNKWYGNHCALEYIGVIQRPPLDNKTQGDWYTWWLMTLNLDFGARTTIKQHKLSPTFVWQQLKCEVCLIPAKSKIMTNRVRSMSNGCPDPILHNIFVRQWTWKSRICTFIQPHTREVMSVYTLYIFLSSRLEVWWAVWATIPTSRWKTRSMWPWWECMLLPNRLLWKHWWSLQMSWMHWL